MVKTAYKGSLLYGKDTSRVLIGSRAVWISHNAHGHYGFSARRTGCAKSRIGAIAVYGEYAIQ